jgi:hypothetical protein
VAITFNKEYLGKKQATKNALEKVKNYPPTCH